MSKPAQWVLIFILAASALAWVPYARYEYNWETNNSISVIVLIRHDRFTGTTCAAWVSSFDSQVRVVLLSGQIALAENCE
jgi:hypothetical protein